jgi:hypothetical protein
MGTLKFWWVYTQAAWAIGWSMFLDLFREPKPGTLVLDFDAGRAYIKWEDGDGHAA